MINQKGVFKKSGDTLWLHCDGRTYTVSLKPEIGPHQQSTTTKNLKSGVMLSPMPGKIHQLPVIA